MAEPGILGLGLVLGFLFCLLMVFKILPPLDHIVKKNRGPVEACVFTRFCPLVIGLPFYVFTIWMTTVIVFSDDKGVSVIEEICPENFDCTNSFSLGRAQFDKEVCLSIDFCPQEELQARSGQKPLHFPRLGLGEEVSPTNLVTNYECIGFENGTCVEVTSLLETCECTTEPELDSFPLDCESDNCLDDAEGNERVSECLNDNCTEWSVTTDSKKQFSFQTCSCTDDDCVNFVCSAFVMPYFYPNTFYAGAATILFVLPAFIGFYLLLKTHMKKAIPCQAPKMYVYNQEAGMQDEFVAENLATGGFNQEQSEKSSSRPFGFKDGTAFIVFTVIILFFSWYIVLVSGRVGLAFISLVPALVLLVESHSCYKYCKNLKDENAERIERNNPDPLKGEF